MKRRTLANPHKEWDGFRFTSYSLAEEVLKLPVTLFRSGYKEKVATTVGEIYDRTADCGVEFDEPAVYLTIKTETEELLLGDSSFGLKVLHVLLHLRRDGINPFGAHWFWYDHDSCLNDPHEIYSFFVVANDKIVREHVSFSDYIGGNCGFDPSVFYAGDDIKPTWVHDRAKEEAWNLFWYRRFCQETKTGQRMILRRDRPGVVRLLDPWPFLRRDSPIASLLWRLLPESVVLRWVVIVVGILVVLRLWR